VTKVVVTIVVGIVVGAIVVSGIVVGTIVVSGIVMEIVVDKGAEVSVDTGWVVTMVDVASVIDETTLVDVIVFVICVVEVDSEEKIVVLVIGSEETEHADKVAKIVNIISQNSRFFIKFPHFPVVVLYRISEDIESENVCWIQELTSKVSPSFMDHLCKTKKARGVNPLLDS
jgi:hypothetical protein